MLHNNKGSILVTSLIFFTIIINVCLSCIEIISSNNKYFKSQYEHTKMKELAISGIEVTKSNILQEAKYAIENFDEESAFNEYFLGNTRDIIGEVSGAGLENVRVNISKRATLDSEGDINFVIESLCKENNYSKRVKADVKILNPWTKDMVESQKEAIDEETEKKDVSNIEEKNELKENIETTENSIGNVNETELVVIYNYEEN